MKPLNDRDGVMHAVIEGTTDAVFVKDEEGKTALFYATDNDNEEIAKLLRARGAVE